MKVDSLDANLVVRYILRDNLEQHAKVKSLLHKSGVIHRLEFMAIAEIVYILEKHYDLPRELAIDLLSFFLAEYDNCISYNHYLTSKVFPFYLAHPKLSFDDCYLATLAEINNAAPLYTFDKKLASQHPSAKLLS